MFLDTSFLKNDEIFLKLKKTFNGDDIKQWVPAYYFAICLLDGTEVGTCELRIGHNDNTYYGGNVGYSIYPEQRGHHFAGKACFLLLELAKKHAMKYLIITCNPENIASRKTCEYAGGILQKIIELPSCNEMYLNGEKQKCIYRFQV